LDLFLYVWFEIYNWNAQAITLQMLWLFIQIVECHRTVSWSQNPLSLPTTNKNNLLLKYYFFIRKNTRKNCIHLILYHNFDKIRLRSSTSSYSIYIKIYHTLVENQKQRVTEQSASRIKLINIFILFPSSLLKAGPLLLCIDLTWPTKLYSKKLKNINWFSTKAQNKLRKYNVLKTCVILCRHKLRVHHYCL
jgi:hypothetical protein